MAIEKVRELAEVLRQRIGRAIIGQDEAVKLLLIGLIAEGHLLFEGPPGTGKTLLARAFAACLKLDFKRVQFTPDLMPGDLVGTNLFNFQTNSFTLTKGPVFTELLLADEINRTPPKTQAALLEAMQERTITIDGTSHVLSQGFMVLATQNPIEQEGTYPLPEAQLDRFMLKVRVGYPSRDEEKEVLLRMSSGHEITVERLLQPGAILSARAAIADLYMDQKVVDYIVDLVRATRDPGSVGLLELKPLIAFGGSPRASIALAQAGLANAFLRGRAYVVPEDIRALAPDVLRHRIVLTFEAEAEDLTTDDVVAKVLGAVRVP
jgi:MoxR-like ATPase